MDIHEYQTKRIFADNGIPVLKGGVAYTAEEARQIAVQIGGGKWAVKVQLYDENRATGHFVSDIMSNHAGVQYANTPDGVYQKTAEMLGKQFKTPSMPTGQIIRRVYVEEECTILVKMAVSIWIDGTTQGAMLALEMDGKTKQFPMPGKPTMLFWQKVARRLGIHGGRVLDMIRILKGLYQVFQKYQTYGVEIRPLIVTEDEKLIALNGRIIFDDNALFRYPEIAALREVAAGHEREAIARKSAFKYMGFDGNIACLVNGSGLGAATVDLIESRGGHVACLLDVGTEPSKEAVSLALKLALSEPDIDGVFINIFGGITRCDVIAQGLISASGEIAVGLPMVVRMDGTNANVGMRLLFDSRLPFTVIKSLEEATETIIRDVEALA